MLGWQASMCHLEASNILLEVVTLTEIFTMVVANAGVSSFHVSFGSF
jgi:hypothetical protein